MTAQPTRPPAAQFDHVQEAPQWGGYWGTGGRDLLVGTDGSEQLTGDGGNDFIEAGAGDDRIYAGAGDDTILAGTGDDLVTGDDDRDWLEGGDGRDLLYAGAGADTLSGGAGDGDVLSGGAGADTYLVRRGDGRDVVEGFFRNDGDRLDLSDFASVLGGIGSFTELKAAGRVTGTDPWGGDTIIRLTDTDAVVLRWVNPRDLTDDQFVFARAPANGAPTDIRLSASAIAENAAPGTVVGSLSAVDPDAGDAARFALLDDAGGAFALAGDGRTLLATRSFDHEAGPTALAVTVRATDAGGLTLDKVLTIAVENVDEAVMAEADRYAAVEDTVLTVSAAEGVLANDSAPDGGKAALAGTITTEQGGTVVLAADGGFTYAPRANANGRDSFTYTLTDRDGSTATGSVTLDVAAVQDPIAPVLLSDVAAGRGGFKIVGEKPGGFAGSAVSSIGDINGDGRSDLLVGSQFNVAGEAGGETGAAYLVLGKTDTATVNLKAVAAGVGGIKLTAGQSGDILGISVAAAGDVNGDGFIDLVVGAAGDNEAGVKAGAAYLVFGTAEPAAIDLAVLAAETRGFKIIGESEGNMAGRSVSGAEDVNGDGLADVLVGAIYNEAGGGRAGAAYVVFGKTDMATVDLDAVAAGLGGFKIIGESAGDLVGYPVSVAGDVNGDGLADLLLGSSWNDAGGNDAGAAYVVFGKTDTVTVDLDAVAAGQGGFKLTGEAANSFVGRSVSAAGDIKGDGLADILVGAPGNEGTGAAYVVFGKADTTPVGLGSVAAGLGGFKISGQSGGTGVGRSVSAVGDMNGDGRNDILIGCTSASSAGGDRMSAAFLVFGKADTAAVELDAVAAGLGGFKMIRENFADGAGQSVSAAGDTNGDGLADLLVSAHADDAGGTDAGAAYVVFGSRDWLA